FDTLYPPPVFTFRLFRLGDNYSDTGGVNEYGEITSNWPSGFLDAAYNATMEIMKNKSVKVES
ncbi:DUF3696 domain-containing protein, partial [Aeromonas caviae]|uniref:DUF3696 domain-containing protein n=1 Tax=Aeromonas caviae TaxID=648 RepID=UPI002B482174